MTSIQMPQLGETIVEGTILKWLKQEGETIERDEPLFEISTDKVDTEVPSPVTGTVAKILVPEGATVPVGTELAMIESEDGEAAQSTGAPAEVAADLSPAAAAETPVEPASPEPEAARPPDRGPRSQILSPLVRRLAAEHDLDRITKGDVEQAIASKETRTTMPAPAPAAAQPAAVAEALPGPAVATGAEEVVAMSHIRKAIAHHMVTSNQTAARAWTLVEANVEHLVRLRDKHKEAFARKHGVKLTYLPFVVRAAVDALLAFPMMNAELRGEDLVVRRFVNMGIAVSYDQGLIVPVVKGADAMNSVGIARAISDLAARARAHQLRPDEVQGATFTITNPGPYGSIASVPIINQPNTGILSLDAIVKRPVVIDDAIAIRHMVNVSMSWDHRVVDGEIATRFLTRVKQNLETWDFAEDLGL
jgi:2-oxoglutarate dehydrogenase E2 component (dihydrolipoamide succinyltransferase)